MVGQAGSVMCLLRCEEWRRELSYLKFRGLAHRPFTGKEKPWLITEVCSCYKISDPC